MRDDERVRSWPRTALATTGLLATAVATTYFIKTGVSAEVQPPATTPSPRTVVATVGPSTPTAVPHAATVTVEPAAASERPVLVSAPAGAAQPPMDLRQVVYTVAGNQRPDDPVTVIYADETGTLQTLEDVTLPWTLSVTPDLPVNYVYAKSRGSQLNCWITDISGSAIAARTEYSPTTSCNR